MISGASEEDLIIAIARADIILKLSNTNEYKSWIILDNYIDKLQDEKEELEKENKEIKEDISFCLKSIEQEMKMSTDSRTRQEMKSCFQILKEWNDK